MVMLLDMDLGTSMLASEMLLRIPGLVSAASMLVPPSVNIEINIPTTEIPLKPNSFVASNALVRPGAK